MNEPSGFTSGPRQERRAYPRFKVNLAVEVTTEASDIPIRCTTADLSFGGCYIETLFPLRVGRIIDLKLQINGTLLIEAKVVTSHTQVGNGIQFLKMLPEDREELKAYLETAARNQQPS
jgi:c-di-GMP-binding flagellar brake protein YcgR